MQHYGIIGYPLTHSFSPGYFSKKFREERIDAIYAAYPIADIALLPALISEHNLQGLNITIPYKEAVISYLNELDETAKNVGAVNCIAIKKGIKKGYNTDVIGFEKSLMPLLNTSTKKALILGTGGAAKAVAYVLDKLGIIYKKVSRSTQADTIGYNEITGKLINEYKLIINTTPLGMFPDTDSYPDLGYRSLTPQHILYDLIYNPTETKFLFSGKQQGAVIKNGYEMLVLQAEASWEIWSK